MYGWRARIGIINPSIPLDNALCEFDQLVPEGVLLVHTSLHIQYLRQEDFDRALSKIDEAAQIMVEGEAECIVAGGDPVVALRGTDADIVERITRIAHVPTTTTLGASIAALKRLGAVKIVVASPYVEERNRLLAGYLEKQGLQVLATKGLGLSRAMDIAKLPFYASYKLGREAFAAAPNADALYFPCARFPVVGNIEMLETDLGKPVVSNVQAMVWWGLEMVGIQEPIIGYGRLLEERP